MRTGRPLHLADDEAGCARCGGELLRVTIVPNLEFTPHLLALCGQCATPDEVAYADSEGKCPGCGIAMRFSCLEDT